VSQLFDAIGKITGDQLITTGAILGYKILPIPVRDEVAVIESELHVYSPVADSGKVQVLIEGEVINQGSGKFWPDVKLVITPESGGEVITEDTMLANDSVESWLSAIYLGTGAKASFKFEKEYTTSELPVGNYTTNVYIMESAGENSPYMTQKLGEANRTMKVLSTDSIGLLINGSVYDTGFPSYENYVNISLKLGSDCVVNGLPSVVYWRNSTWFPLPKDKIVSSMTEQSGNYWTLYEKCLLIPSDLPIIQDVYEFRIIISIQIAGKSYELITHVIEIVEP
jgi:hypothetical protein